MLDKKNIIIISLLFILYFLLFPLNPGKNLFLSRGEAIELVSVSGVAGENPIPFHFKEWGGFINSNMKSAYSLKVKDGLVLTEDSFINYSLTDKSISLMNSVGEEIFSIPNIGYPFSVKNRILIISRDSKSLSEISNGEVIWSRNFNSLITSVDGNDDYIVLGFSKGNFIVLNRDGSSYFTYEPGGSRVSIIYNVKISEDSKYISVVSGLDPQRFILYEKRSREYKPIFSHKLKDEFREKVNIFMPDNSNKLFLEGRNSLFTIDIGSDYVKEIESPLSLVNVEYIEAYDLYLVHSGARNFNNLKLLTSENSVVFDKDFTGEGVNVSTRGSLIYIILDGKAITIELEEFR